MTQTLTLVLQPIGEEGTESISCSAIRLNHGGYLGSNLLGGDNQIGTRSERARILSQSL